MRASEGQPPQKGGGALHSGRGFGRVCVRCGRPCLGLGCVFGWASPAAMRVRWRTFRQAQALGGLAELGEEPRAERLGGVGAP
jgi:hypothetical protein